MSNYVGQVNINRTGKRPLASTLYGVCNTPNDQYAKEVTLADFNQVLHGVTIHIKFRYGNYAPLNENLTLKVGSAPAYRISCPGGTAMWSTNQVISFTFDANDARWITNDSNISSLTIMNTFDATSEGPISGMGVADAISDLGTAAYKNAATSITNNNRDSDNEVPTNNAIVEYVDSVITGTFPSYDIETGQYGPLEDKTLSNSETFKVPLISVDAAGRITTISNTFLTLPADDHYVAQQGNHLNTDYPILMKYTDDQRGETAPVLFGDDEAVTINPSVGSITAPGGFIGNASSATIAGTARAVEWVNVGNKPTLIIGGVSINLSDISTYTITAASLRQSLGLSQALRFIGYLTIQNEHIVPVTANHVLTIGDVGLLPDEGNGYIEYVCVDIVNGYGVWEQLGDTFSFKIKQDAYDSNIVTADDAGITFISRIVQNINGNITNIEKTEIRLATASQSGLVSTLAQTFSGIKTFSNEIIVGTQDGLTINYNSINAGSELFLQNSGGTIDFGTSSHTVTASLYGTLTLANADNTQTFYAAPHILTISGISGQLHDYSPTISLNLANNNDVTKNWTIINQNGEFSLSNTLVTLVGAAKGFEVDRLYINENLPNVTDGNTPRLSVNGNTRIHNNLNVDENIEITGKIGIGTSINNSYRAVIQGNILIKDNLTDLSYFDITTRTIDNDTYKLIQFYPYNQDLISELGTITNPWTNIFLQDLLSVTGANPTIEFNYLNNEDNAPNGSNWSISLDSNNYSDYSYFQLVSHHTVENDQHRYNTIFTGVPNGGFTFYPRVYINNDIIANNTDSLYVNGTSKFIPDVLEDNQGNPFTDFMEHPTVRIEKNLTLTSEDQGLAYLYLYQEPTENDLFLNYVIFAPDDAMIGTLGTDSHRWTDLYLKGTFDIIDSESNYQTILDNTEGYIRIQAAQPSLQLYTYNNGNRTPPWYIATELMQSNPNDQLSAQVCLHIYPYGVNNGADLKGFPQLGFKVNKRLYINGSDFDDTYHFYVDDESGNGDANIVLNGKVGIGTNSDIDINSNQAEAYLRLQDYLVLVHDSNNNNEEIAHLKYEINNVSGSSSLLFYPKEKQSNENFISSIGLDGNRWDELYLTSLLDIVTSHDSTDESIKLGIESNNNTYTSKLEINSGNDTSIAELSTTNSTGTLYITSQIPSIELEYNYNSTLSTWSILAAETALSFSNSAANSEELIINQTGVTLNKGLFINTGIDTDYQLIVNGQSYLQGKTGIGVEADNAAYLTVQNYIKLVDSNEVALAHLQYNINKVQFYPEVAVNLSGYGEIGTETNRWASGYFSDELEIKKSNNNSILLDNSSTSPIMKFIGGAPSISFREVWTIEDSGNSSNEFTIGRSNSIYIKEVYGNPSYIKLYPRVQIGNLASGDSLSSTDCLYVGGDVKITGMIYGGNISFEPDSTVQSNVNNTFGGPTQPIWWDRGAPKPLTYTAHRLYYSDSTTSFEATEHYADTTHICINSTSLPNGSPNLYVSGTTTITGATVINTTLDVDGNTTIGGIITVNGAINGNGQNAIKGDLIIEYDTYTDSINNTTIEYGNILPSDDNKQELGNNSARWKALHIGSTNLYGGITSSQNSAATLEPNGNTNLTTVKLIYWDNKPVELASGTNIGSGIVPIYLKDGELIASTQTVGTNNQFVYLSNGHITAASQNIGDKYTPTYVNEGVITKAVITQTINFTISANKSGVRITNPNNEAVITKDTYVLQCVVTSGFSYLQSPLKCTVVQALGNAEDYYLDIETHGITNNNTSGASNAGLAVTGNITGYVVIARGGTTGSQQLISGSWGYQNIGDSDSE